MVGAVSTDLGPACSALLADAGGLLARDPWVLHAHATNLWGGPLAPVHNSRVASGRPGKGLDQSHHQKKIIKNK